MPVDKETGKRYPYTAEGKAAFRRDQAKKKKRGKKKRGRRDDRDSGRGGLADIIAEAKARAGR